MVNVACTFPVAPEHVWALTEAMEAIKMRGEYIGKFFEVALATKFHACYIVPTQPLSTRIEFLLVDKL